MKAKLSTFLLLSGALWPLNAGASARRDVPATRPASNIQEPTPLGSGAHHDLGSPGSAPDPSDLIRSKWTAILAVLQDTGLDTAAKEAEIERIAGPVIDFVLMGKLALGRAHWGRLTAGQRRTYLQRFEERIKKSYREKIALYEGEGLWIDFSQDDPAQKSNASPANQAGGKKTKTARVTIGLHSLGKRASVLHKLRWFDNRWRVYDVEIEGVSILLTYRSQFHDILRTCSVEELLTRMQEPLPGQPSSAPNTGP